MIDINRLITHQKIKNSIKISEAAVERCPVKKVVKKDSGTATFL